MSAGDRSHRLLALALLVALLAASAVAAWVAAARYLEAEAEIADRLDRIARFERLALDADGLERAIEDLDLGGRWAALLVDAPSDRVATADLQQRLKTIVARTGGNLTSARVLESESIDAFRKVGLEVRAALDTGGLRDTLYVLEAGEPMLIVEDLVVVARRVARRRNARAKAQPLDVRFRLVGFMPEPTASPAGPGAAGEARE